MSGAGKSKEPFDRKRGRHKKRASRETKVWEQEHMIPARPAWMPEGIYRRLAQMRERNE